MGFACGTCIECGYNYLDNTYHFIEVRTELLEQLVSPDVFEYLVAEHDLKYKIEK
jgi:hypothetical protein